MKAALCPAYGPADVIQIQDIPDPSPTKGTVVVRVHAVAVTSGDARLRGANFPGGFGPIARVIFGFTKPRTSILGGAFSGVIESVGPGVTGWAVGQRVCGMTGAAMGMHAEKARVKATHLVAVPDDVSHEDAAGLLFGGTTAWHFLHTLADLKAGASVLVIGGSGAVGTNAIQIAHAAGAKVTAVSSARNAELVRSLGAADVIDYTNTDIARLDARYDVVLETVGSLNGAQCKQLLAPHGVALLASAGLKDMLTARGNVKAAVAAEDPAVMAKLLERVASGAMTVVNQEVFGLDRIVDAYRIVDSGRKVGNVIVTPAP